MHPLLLRAISMVYWFGMLLAIIALASVIGSVSLTHKLHRERFTLEGEIRKSALDPDLSHARRKIFLGHMPLV